MNTWKNIYNITWVYYNIRHEVDNGHPSVFGQKDVFFLRDVYIWILQS